MITTSRRAVAPLLTALILLLSTLLLGPTASAAQGAAPLNAYENDLLVRTNAQRSAAGVPTLTAEAGLTDVARSWAAELMKNGAPIHNPGLAESLDSHGASGWLVAAENVAQGGSSSAVFSAFLASPAHKDNLVRAAVRYVGIGAVRGSDGRVWDVMTFTDSYDRAYGAPRSTLVALDPSGNPPTTTPTPTPTPPAATGTGPVLGLAGKCLALTDGRATNSQPVRLSYCNGKDNQRWSIVSDGPAKVLGKCLDVKRSEKANGTTVQLYDCNSTPGQRWQPRSDGSLFNPNSGRCLDVPSANADSTRLQVYDCNGSKAQRWTLPA